MTDASLVLVAAAGIALLLFLVIHLKLHAFVALLVVSILVGIAAGMPLAELLDSLKDGMGNTLGFVAIVVGLGAMFGQILEISGGAEQLAQTLVKRFGEDNAQWALGTTGFIVSIPVFFDVGFIILVPIVYGLTRKTGRSLLYYGVPLMAGMGVTHSFIPPTPGPIAVAELLNADLGWVILFGTIAGIPAMIVAGPLFARYIAKRIDAQIPDYIQFDAAPPRKELPGFSMVASIIFLPLVLILLGTFSSALLPEASTTGIVLSFLGHPFSALIIATLLAFYLLGTRRGYGREELQKIGTKALEPAGIIILVTGAGGLFKQVLIDSGVGDVLGNVMANSSMPPVLLGFAIAAIVRVSQGSATVAMITAAGIVSPIISVFQLTGPVLGLMAIAVASGATILSHVNDSGFWLVKQYLGLSEKETLLSWTVLETLIGVIGFSIVFAISLFL